MGSSGDQEPEGAVHPVTEEVSLKLPAQLLARLEVDDRIRRLEMLQCRIENMRDRQLACLRFHVAMRRFHRV